MIETISPERGRMKDAATVAAAANYRPTFQTLSQVKPEPDLVKSIGFSTNADAFRGSSPDLQSLLDALLSNFGDEHDLVEDETSDLETNSAIRQNNDGSREAVTSLRNTANQGEKTVGLDRQVEDQRSKFQERADVADTDTERLYGTTESRLDTAENELGEAESLSTRAKDATTKEPISGSKQTQNGQKRERSAEVFEQKAAAAESAARLHRVMVRKVLSNAQTQLEQERERRQSSTFDQLANDPEFAERLREMNRILREKR